MTARLSTIIALFILSGCATTPPVIVKPPTGIPLPVLCERYRVTWQFDGVTQVVLLEHQGAMAKALVGSPVVLVGKQKIILSAPLRRQQSTIYVPEDFEAMIMAPFGILPSTSRAPDLSTSPIRTIVIDAGHGGKDSGATGISGVKEKNVVLDIARKLKVLLEEAGFRVIMTRSTDEFISLAERTVIATRPDVDLFVSIHANANPSRKTKGVEVYYVKTFDKKDLDEEQRQQNEKMFAQKLKMENTPLLQSIVADMMYRHKTLQSPKLADGMVRETARHVQSPNRGARPCRFFVIRNTLVPAILVETGFLTNRLEEHKLNSGGYRQRLAEAIAHSIVDYATSF